MDLMEYVPKTWRDKKKPMEWASIVLKHRDSCLEAESEAVQARFVEHVKDHPLYGTCFFHVRKHRFPTQMNTFPEHCVIALNSEGLHFLGADERDTLSSFGYADIYRWGGSSTQFSIIIWNAESEDTDVSARRRSAGVQQTGEPPVQLRARSRSPTAATMVPPHPRHPTPPRPCRTSACSRARRRTWRRSSWTTSTPLWPRRRRERVRQSGAAQRE